ncbi:MAG: peptidoglycan-binding domain-containing protein [Terriglobales bacterium]
MKLSNSISTTCLSAGCIVLLACGAVSAQTKSQSPTPPTPATASSAAKLQKVSAHSTSRKGKKSRKSASSKRGQQKIDPERAREIQDALIREHYLEGTASGTWDAKTQSAMQRYQEDNGWQSKSVPDSRALIKMGLGPDHEHLLNPESAMTSEPEAPRASPMMIQSPAMVTPPQR